MQETCQLLTRTHEYAAVVDYEKPKKGTKQGTGNHWMVLVAKQRRRWMVLVAKQRRNWMVLVA